MLSIDDRTGSRELAPLFTDYGISTRVCRLPFGDFSWTGRGPKNYAVSVCVERKKITEFIDSIKTKRLSGHQLPGMAGDYDYGYLIIEGFWGVQDDGSMHVNKQRQGIHFRAVDSFLCSMELKGGLIFRRTINAYETVAHVANWYRWWTEKSWDEHESCEAVYAPAMAADGRKFLLQPREVGALEKMVMQLPGLDRGAQQIARVVKSMEALCKLSVEEMAAWKMKDKKGNFKRFGMSRAEKVWEALHGTPESL